MTQINNHLVGPKGRLDAIDQFRGFADNLDGEMTQWTVPLAGIAEMADRVQAGNWEPNLDLVLFDY